MKLIQRIFLAALSLGVFTSAAIPAVAAPRPTERVVLAGGCFWGMQAVFSSLKGVTKTEAGYAGGTASTANYESVSSETTGQAESVAITFDPSRISFKQLLDVYFTVAHDPTELNRQGPDQGSSYRSEIFYTSSAQRDEARAEIAALQRAHTYGSPIVTTLHHLPAFYPAEAYHQNYLVRNPHSGYIVYNDIPKLQALRAKFPSLVNAQSPTMRIVE